MSIPTPRWFEDEQLIALILPGALLGTLGLGEGFVALDWMTRGGTGQHALLLVGVVVTFGVGYPWMMRRWRRFEEARETARMTILRSLETDHLEELLDRPSLTRDEKRLVLYILGNERPEWVARVAQSLATVQAETTDEAPTMNPTGTPTWVTAKDQPDRGTTKRG